LRFGEVVSGGETGDGPQLSAIYMMVLSAIIIIT
jgi:hypothetical protein